MAESLSPSAAFGHFDELRGTAATAKGASPAGLAQPWASFFEHLGTEGFADLNQRMGNLERQVRDNGITYNVYADSHGPQRPWALDLFPLIVTPENWQKIEAGILQRVNLLDHLMADVYGPQKLLKEGLVPSALVHGHPGYLRALRGVNPAGNTHLHIAAFDLARDVEGNWWVVAQRTQAPSGLGYILENRIIVSRQFPEAFRHMGVQRLAASYSALVEGLRAMSPAGNDSRIVLLTPGPYNETYFEHAYLARYLGLTLVEGSDLTVRDQKVFLKTLRGLQPVHGMIKRVDDEFLDPLELRSDSRLGVPGLLQAIRAGNLLVANAPGSAFLESSALLGFLPALSRHVLHEELLIPSVATWWCGERAAMESVLPQLAHSVIRPTWPHSAQTTVLGRSLSRREADEWAGRIMRRADEYTVQNFLPLSQMPTWQRRPDGDRIAPRSNLLRVFAVSDGPRSWRLVPGGMARLATSDLGLATMQRGGSSADVWALTHGKVDGTTLLAHNHAGPSVLQRSRQVTSRAAENLYWLGRYTERTENCIRLARLTLDSLNGEGQTSQELLAWLSTLAEVNALVLPSVPPATQSQLVFERSLIAALGDTTDNASIGHNLRALKNNAGAVRERLSLEQWNVILEAEATFMERCKALHERGDYASADAMRVLEAASRRMAAITGAQIDRMTRDDGWRLLSMGRLIERFGFLAKVLVAAFESGAIHEDGGYEAVLVLFDSTITFHAQYQRRHDIEALLELLMTDQENPRSLGWIMRTLRGRLAKLDGAAPGVLTDLALQIPDPEAWSLHDLVAPGPEGKFTALMEELERCTTATFTLSEMLSARHFTHSDDARRSLGA
jgi:uncharacterized circularly permuted ATP-grasp superfamily protein/uncharacterized alpha-E superfamily protein